MKRTIALLSVVILSTAVSAQYVEPDPEKTPVKPLDSIRYNVSMQTSVSKGKTPLWLNANKYGLSSLNRNNGYLRGSLVRNLSVDDGKKFGIGYGVDLVLPVNYTSKFVVQQAYVEGRWLHGVLAVGSKERSMELKDNSLSSGSQTLGINARPVPQVLLELQDWTVPFTRGWLHLRGHIAYGRMTDDNWQHDFTLRQSKYSDDVLYHSKAGYLTIGNQDVFCPWSLELGLEMATLFGGKSYIPQSDGSMEPAIGSTGVKDYWHAFIPFGSSDIGETTYRNVEGDQLGSWVMRLGYDGDWNSFAVYADKFFEDHSALFHLDYDGYGEGEEWMNKKERRYLLYDLKDWMLGFEFKHKPDNWINDLVVEYLYTKYQSGPIYHDHTKTIADHIGGNDDYYNHFIYTGWQHWGQSIGNPLYRSPIYNEDGRIEFKNNRFMALHLGLGGHPSEQLKWRLLATWQEGFGTYSNPFTEKHHHVSVMGEASYKFITPQHRWLHHLMITTGVGADFGSIFGKNDFGFQLTISKSGIFKL